MTALMSQLTCVLCYEKIDESKWKAHIIPTKHILKCKSYDSFNATKFFEKVFDVRPETEQIHNLNNAKTHDFWRLYIFNTTTKGEI